MFTLIWQSLLRSSVWVGQSKEVRLLWITLLALKDRNGFVRTSLVGLADAAKLTLEEMNEALDVLMSPDPNDTSGVEDGIRVRPVPGGFFIVNHELYRFSTEAKREYNRIKQQEHRNRKKLKVPMGKTAQEKAYENSPEAVKDELHSWFQKKQLQSVRKAEPAI